MKELAIDAERIGLPATATAEEIVAKVHTIMAIEAERDKWRAQYHEQAANNIELRKKVDANEAAFAELAVKKVFDSKRLDRKLEPIGLELYKTNKEVFVKWAEAMEDKSLLEISSQIRGSSAPPSDPVAEVESRANELMAKDETFKGRKGSAMSKVLADDPDLCERYNAKMVAKSKGGEG